MANNIPNRTQAERADQTRARILDAAIRAFSDSGLAGARTEQIAEAAGVNKALLYYYFQGKDALYTAALQDVAQRVVISGKASMGTAASAGDRGVHFARKNFDRSHTKRTGPSLVQQAIIRLHRGEEDALTLLVETVFRPMVSRIREAVE